MKERSEQRIEMESGFICSKTLMRTWTAYPSGTMAAAKGPRHPMESMTVINRVKDHKGRPRIQLSKYWPDGTRYRRFAPNPTVAKKVEARIDESIAMGTWRELKAELSKGPDDDLTIRQFADVYLEEYC